MKATKRGEKLENPTSDKVRRVMNLVFMAITVHVNRVSYDRHRLAIGVSD